LKERKEKRKAKGKKRGHSSSALSAARSSAAAGSGLSGRSLVPGVVHGGVPGASPLQPAVGNGRLFQAYDMVAPPNKVTPTAAYLNTAANRFSHSHNSSAFTSPRHYISNAAAMPRLAWDSVDPTGLGATMSGLAAAGGTAGLALGAGAAGDPLTHPRAYGGLGMAGLGMGLLPSVTQSQSLGAPDPLPVLSDLLGYRQTLLDMSSPSGSSTISSTSSGGRSGESTTGSALPPSHPHPPAFLGAGSSPRGLADISKLPNLTPPPAHSNNLSAPPGPLGLGRVYPYPFIADPPMLLSSLHQHTDALRHAPLWPTPPSSMSSMFSAMGAMNGADAYKPVMISSFTNPFFSAHPAPPPPSTHWPPPPPPPHPSGAEPAPGAGYPR
jgi:hypothetical protein